jgi:hypothetical protein
LPDGLILLSQPSQRAIFKCGIVSSKAQNIEGAARGLVRSTSRIPLPIKLALIGKPVHSQSMLVLFTIRVQLHQMRRKPFSEPLSL